MDEFDDGRFRPKERNLRCRRLQTDPSRPPRYTGRTEFTNIRVFIAKIDVRATAVAKNIGNPILRSKATDVFDDVSEIRYHFLRPAIGWVACVFERNFDPSFFLNHFSGERGTESARNSRSLLAGHVQDDRTI